MPFLTKIREHGNERGHGRGSRRGRGRRHGRGRGRGHSHSRGVGARNDAGRSVLNSYLEASRGRARTRGGIRPLRPHLTDPLNIFEATDVHQTVQLEQPHQERTERVFPERVSSTEVTATMALWSTVDYLVRPDEVLTGDDEVLTGQEQPEPVPVKMEVDVPLDFTPVPSLSMFIDNAEGSLRSTPTSTRGTPSTLMYGIPSTSTYSTPSTSKPLPLRDIRKPTEARSKRSLISTMVPAPEVAPASTSAPDSHLEPMEPVVTPASEVTSRSRRHRPLGDDEILNYGSEDDDDVSLEDEDLGDRHDNLPIPRALRNYFNEEDEDLCLQPALVPTLVNAPVPAVSQTVPSDSSANNPLGPTGKFIFEWGPCPQPPIDPRLRREVFSVSHCGPTVCLAEPYDAFTAIWDRPIMEHIVVETNRYAQQLAAALLASGALAPSSRITKWRDTTVEELYLFFAIVLAMGSVVKTRIEEYWSTVDDIFITPRFSTVMSYDRFVLLCTCLHFQDNSAYDPGNMSRAQAKLFKIEPILKHVNNKFQSLYNLSQNIALDESLTMWKGWLDINQFIHNKAATVGIKTYEICDSLTGYLWKFEVHAGHDHSNATEDDPLSGVVPTLVLKLLNGLENRGHTVWMVSAPKC